MSRLLLYIGFIVLTFVLALALKFLNYYSDYPEGDEVRFFWVVLASLAMQFVLGMNIVKGPVKRMLGTVALVMGIMVAILFGIVLLAMILASFEVYLSSAIVILSYFGLTIGSWEFARRYNVEWED